MDTSSAAYLLFEDVKNGGMTFIKSLVSNLQQETEWLDFKLPAEHQNDNKRTWSECVSGFANNQGGVIIWGIDARREKGEAVDAAREIALLPDPAGFASRLRELVRNTTDPPLLKIDIRTFHEDGDHGSGVVACFIPEGEHKPYRAELATNKPYMVRLSDSFQVLPTQLLKSMFYPRSTPLFEVFFKADWESPVEDVDQMFLPIRVYLRNAGTTSVRDLFVTVFSIHATMFNSSNQQANPKPASEL